MNPIKWLRKKIIQRKLLALELQLKSYKQLVHASGLLMIEYDRKISKKRTELHIRMDRLYRQASGEVLFRFLIHFSAIGFHMTHGIPEWFRNAGKACLANGFKAAGKDLIHHADEEDGHHLWFESDLKNLLQMRHKQTGGPSDSAEILRHARAACVENYVSLHEGVINSPHPFAWLALKYEIELLSLDLGPRFIGKCVEELGFGILKCLSFVNKHTLADIDHIKSDINGLKEILDERPDALDLMVRIGENSIEAYARFFEEAFARAENAELLSSLPDILSESAALNPNSRIRFS